MPIYRVEFHYFCAGYRHENHTTKYFRAKNIDDVEKRFPAMLTCVYCEPGTFIESRVDAEFEISEISELGFSESGAALEPDIV
jgi:hypothetical protein